MKIVTLIARILLGLMFLVFGSNMFFNFISMGPMPGGNAGQFMGAMFVSHHFYVIGFLMVISGILMLVDRYVPLALIFLGPILVNILLYHILMHREGAALAVFATLLWLLVYWGHRAAFRGVFQARVKE